MKERKPAANMGLAIAGVQWLIEALCFYFTFVLADSLVLNQSAVLRLNFCAEMPPLRQAAKRCSATLNLCRQYIVNKQGLVSKQS